MSGRGEIRLEAAPYCATCADFDPVSEKDIRWSNGEAYVAGISVRCVHAARCREIETYIREEMAGQGQ